RRHRAGRDPAADLFRRRFACEGKAAGGRGRAPALPVVGRGRAGHHQGRAEAPCGKVERTAQTDGVSPRKIVAKTGMSILPPDRMTPARVPFRRALSCISAANAAAPAPSAVLWVAV